VKSRLKRLSAYRPRPREGEEIPVQFLDLEKKIAAWSPELRHTVYADDPEEVSHLKRIREVFLLRVFSWYRDGEAFIELDNEERMRFEDVLHEFLLYGGEILYFRKKEGRRYTNHFRLLPDSGYDASINGWLLAEKL
jgi:hypothetical protein